MKVRGWIIWLVQYKSLLFSPFQLAISAEWPEPTAGIGIPAFAFRYSAFIGPDRHRVTFVRFRVMIDAILMSQNGIARKVRVVDYH